MREEPASNRWWEYSQGIVETIRRMDDFTTQCSDQPACMRYLDSARLRYLHYYLRYSGRCTQVWSGIT